MSIQVYMQFLKDHNQQVEKFLTKLVTDGHLLDDLYVTSALEGTSGAVVIYTTKVYHRSSGKLLTTIN